MTHLLEEPRRIQNGPMDGKKDKSHSTANNKSHVLSLSGSANKLFCCWKRQLTGPSNVTPFGNLMSFGLLYHIPGVHCSWRDFAVLQQFSWVDVSTWTGPYVFSLSIVDLLLLLWSLSGCMCQCWPSLSKVQSFITSLPWCYNWYGVIRVCLFFSKCYIVHYGQASSLLDI